MNKGRMEAFSDGVIAIIITIMVLELTAPHEPDVAALRALVPVFLSYVLSFINVGIYWNNHHHLLGVVRHVNGRVLWANLHLLFWLSLIPFGTAWLGENGFATWPVAVYGFILLGAGVAYFILARALIAADGRESVVAAALGRDVKGRASVGIYLLGILLAFVQPRVACALYVLVAVSWLVPDRRMEKAMGDTADG